MVLALAGDYAAGILFSYFMNKRYTFRVEVVSDAKPLSVTVLTYALTFGLNVLLLSLAVEHGQPRFEPRRGLLDLPYTGRARGEAGRFATSDLFATSFEQPADIGVTEVLG